MEFVKQPSHGISEPVPFLRGRRRLQAQFPSLAVALQSLRRSLPSVIVQHILCYYLNLFYFHEETTLLRLERIENFANREVSLGLHRKVMACLVFETRFLRQEFNENEIFRIKNFIKRPHTTGPGENDVCLHRHQWLRFSLQHYHRLPWPK